MTKRPSHEEICKEMAGELTDIASWLADGELTPEQFLSTVAAFEVRKLRRFGLKLSSSISGNRLVHFTLIFADTEEFCASVNVNPATGEMTTQYSCV